MSKNIEALERLARLRETGALSEAEFQIEKAKLLGEGSAPAGSSVSMLIGKGWDGIRPPRGVILGMGIASLSIVLAVAGYWWVKAEGTPSDTAASADEPAALAERFNAADENCRGGAGNDPATQKACSERDTLGAGLDKAGWCETNGGWGPCPRGSGEAPVQRQITDKPLFVLNGGQALEVGTARTLADAYRIQVGWSCKEVDMGENYGIACSDPTSQAGLDMFFGAVSPQGNLLISAGKLRDQNGTSMPLQGDRLLRYLVGLETNAGVLAKR